MPGLLRGVARTAVIAGTATAVSNNVSRRQANRWAEQEQEASAAQQAQYQQEQPAEDPMQALQKLGQLHEAGVLTDEEFAAKKAEILQRM